MSNQLEQSIARLKGEIKAIETSLAATTHNLATAVEAKVEDLEARWKQSLAQYEAKPAGAGQTAERVRHFLAEKSNELVTKYEDWRTDRAIEKLEKDADQKEQQAADAIVAAAFSLMEAEVAILEALKARKVAIEVAG